MRSQPARYLRKRSKTFIHEKHEKHERKNNTLSLDMRVGWDGIPAFLPSASLDTCPATACWDFIPAYSFFRFFAFFVLFVFFVDQAVAFDVFRGASKETHNEYFYPLKTR